MEYSKDVQKKIEDRIKVKDKRQSRTEISINISWAINNANEFCSDISGSSDFQGKSYPNSKWECIKEWYPRFQELYREEMLEQMPEEESKDERPL